MTAADLGEADAEMHLDPLITQHLVHVLVGVVGKRLQQSVAMVDEVDLTSACVEVRVHSRDRVLDHVADRPCDLDSGRATADDHEVERTASDELWISVDLLEQAKDPRTQIGGVVERVERERVLSGAWCAEEVGLRPCS